jgi:transposase
MGTLHVGIDVSNATLDVAFFDSELRSVRPPARYENTPRGHTALRTAAVSAARLVGRGTRIVFGMESTSNMHKCLEAFLRKERRRPVEVHVLNPMTIKNFRRVVPKDSKTDRIDSELIAEYLVRMQPDVAPAPPEGLDDLRVATRSRRRLVESQTEAKNELHGLLRRYFPGYHQRLGKTLSNWVLVVLSEFPSPGDILARSRDKVAALQNGRRGRIGAACAEKVRELAREAPQRQLPAAVSLVIQETASQILQLKRRIAKLDEAIEELTEEVLAEKTHLVCSIPGIGKVSAGSVLAEVGNVDRFVSKEKLVGYSGLYPVVWESGESGKRRFKMTYKGNKFLKTTLLVASAAARQYNPTIATFYERLRVRQKSTKAAGGAIARKLAEIVFAVLQTGQPWSAEIAARGIKKAQAMAAQQS